MKRRIIAMMLLVTGIVHSQDTDPAFSRLVHVDRFAFGGIGYAGVISQGEKDYKNILARPSALEQFERVLSAGNPQGKSYALVGIRKLSPARFEELSRSLRGSKEMVTTEHGCIELHETVRAVVEQIQKGQYSNY